MSIKPKLKRYLTRKYSYFALSLVYEAWADCTGCMDVTGVPDCVRDIEYLGDDFWADMAWMNAAAARFGSESARFFWDFMQKGYRHGEALRDFVRHGFPAAWPDKTGRAELLWAWRTYFENNFAFVFITHPLALAVAHRVEAMLAAHGVEPKDMAQTLLDMSVAPKPNGSEEEAQALWEIKRAMSEPGFDLEAVLLRHTERFGYLGYREPFANGYDVDYYRRRLAEAKAWEPPPPRYPAVFDALPEADREFVRLLDEFVFFRTYRTERAYEALFFMEPCLAAIEEEYGLEQHDASSYSLSELVALLRDGLPVAPERIANRRSAFVFKLHNGKVKILEGEEARLRIADKAGPDHHKRRCVHGMTASRGKARGPVRLVMDARDQDVVQEGDILVTPMTTPDYLPALRKAAGFVTDEGGLTCHAAIVARELKKPCIIGTRNATKVFHNQDMVELDADNGVVKVIAS
ncbi:PEP-utilizing enzyme [Desulfolutivibrio sulfoxidireducens]|uniref:PEP-utilizing enzyme n=1 Tax=Desulfolutivibrio sulfoxidireducens TaxID=2773299 RepID=UPI001C4004DA|nr:PEP-utilizing enzyme [Desulfolutivibrio sulfoxidireducens]